MKIAIFQTDLKTGGIQKSLVHFLDHLSRIDGVDVDLFLFSRQRHFDTPEGIHVHYLSPSRLFNDIPFSWTMASPSFRRAIRPALDTTYDLAIDYSGFNTSASAACLLCQAERKVIYIHSDIKMRLKFNKKFAFLFSMTKKKYPLFDEVVFVTEKVGESYKEILGTKQKSHLIGNLLPTQEIRKRAQEPTDFSPDPQRINLITVSRLSFEKNVLSTVKTMAEAYRENPGLRFYILGDGPEEESIRTYVKENQLEDLVSLEGRKSNPYPYMKEMDYYISESLYEGQGLSVLEAQTLGLDIIVPPHLSGYMYRVEGVDHIPGLLSRLKKKPKKDWQMENYVKSCEEGIDQLLFGEEKHED